MGALASLAQATLPVEPGGEASVDVTIRNTGGVVDQFTIEVLGDGGAWAIAEPPTLSLFPGAEGVTRISFRPPRVSSTPAGAVRFGVMVRSREDSAGSTVEEGTLDVAAFQASSAELIPRTSHGGRRGRHELAIDNRGNSRLEAAVSGVDPNRLVSFDIDPPNVSVDPGGASFARMLVKPVRRFWRGPAKTRSFQVAVQPDSPGVGPLLLDGSFLQESILPWWFTRAIVALLALLVAAVLLWIFVLQPQIRSTAAETLVDFGFSPKPGSVAAGGSGGQPTPGPSGEQPTPGPSGELSITPPPAGEQSQVDGRLDTAANAVTPTAGTLFITDLVFANPTGASGDLTLQRTSAAGTTQLLVLRLENFRDLDYHFVTPIAVRAGETLSLVANCSAPTSPDAGACTPAVFYSGYLQGS
jgi:hypothetical protein